MSPRVGPNNYGLREKMCGGHDTAIFTMLYLILLLWFHKMFKLTSLKLPFRPKAMHAKHWRKLSWTTFLGNFPIPLEKRFCGALMNSCLLEYDTVFPIKNKFQPAILTFYFYLVPPFYFLK